MRILFVHQNFPGQYKHLARSLAANSRNEVVFITKNGNYDIPGVKKLIHEPSRVPAKSTHPYISSLESGVLYGQSVARKALALRKRGWVPDIMMGHCGWGETLFLKDIFPNSPLITYFEFYYNAKGADFEFDTLFKRELDDLLRLRVKNCVNLTSLEATDWGLSPTFWQRSQFPEHYKTQISVVHEGIDTQHVKPDAEARFTLPDGRELTVEDEVITYVARNLEPYRGFHIYVKVLAELCKRRPKAQFVIVGGDDVSYGRRAPGGKTWRETLLKDVEIEEGRVHFVGKVPYGQFLNVLRISSAHIYLTYPFVLSWSLMEAMSAGCCIVASDTKPVQEVITDSKTGLMVDFHDHEAVADKVCDVLERPQEYEEIRARARQLIVDTYDLRSICLPGQIQLMNDVLQRRTPLVSYNGGALKEKALAGE